MAGYQLTDKARAQLDEVYEYSVLNFGLKNAQAYLEGFHGCFEILVLYPELGRNYGHIRLGIRRHDYESHSIYYRIADEGIVIVRILHQRQDPMRNL